MFFARPRNRTKRTRPTTNARCFCARSATRSACWWPKGQPYWDTKFLVQSLKRNTNVDFTAVYRLNATRHVAVVSATGIETRTEQDLLSAHRGRHECVRCYSARTGGGSLFRQQDRSVADGFCGETGRQPGLRARQTLRRTLSGAGEVRTGGLGRRSDCRCEVASHGSGQGNPIFDLGAAGTLDELLDRLPALDQASVTLGEKPLAIVLANAVQPDGPVLIAYQRYGQGKTLSLNASGLWRWSFRETGQEESEVAYQRFWVSLLQWLLGGSEFLPGSDVALTSARRYYTSEQPMQFLISTRNLDRAIYQPRLIIDGPGTSAEVEPRSRGESFVAEAGPFPPGTYRITLKNNVGKPPNFPRASKSSARPWKSAS